MDSVGAEVGQKMRSAIKAKLMELECYVDDELPDYIMVMVANKRTKSQMNEDLNLFLSTKTSTFVNWLHIVLKKLKEVTVTNPDVYKKVTKRKATALAGELPDVKVKKEKKDKKIKKENENKQRVKEKEPEKSLTDDLPITANKLSEQRKIILLNENNRTTDVGDDNNFDIPLLSEVNASNEDELKDIERKIRSVKSRLGMLVESDNEDDNVLNFKADEDEMAKQVDEEFEANRQIYTNTQQIAILEQEEQQSNENREIASSLIQITSQREKTPPNSSETDDKECYTPEKRKEHKRIVFDYSSEVAPPSRKPSILERLGKRASDSDSSSRVDRESDGLEYAPHRKKIVLSEYRKEEDKYLGYSKNNVDKKKDVREEDRYSNRKRNELRSKTSPRRRDRSREDDDRKETKRTGVFSRVGVMSKVSVPPKQEGKKDNSDIDAEDDEIDEPAREVASLIKVKPRVLPPDGQQPNKNLLLKAVAEAHRSIAQAPKVGVALKPDALFTRKFKDKPQEDSNSHKPIRKISEQEKDKLKNLLTKSNSVRFEVSSSCNNDDDDEYDSDGKYISKAVVKKKVHESARHVLPSVRSVEEEVELEEDNVGRREAEDTEVKHNFVITLDGIDKTKFAEKRCGRVRLDGRKTPSPIIFDKTVSTTTIKNKPNIPDKLPVVHPPLSVKIKERCKYWPSCRQGDKCEFAHPTTSCENFPNCKFREKCLYLHPTCKFGSSCTKRDCPYDHSANSKPVTIGRVPAKMTQSALQTCKYYPNCSNVSCLYFHPKPCKYGKFCKNIGECLYVHNFVAAKRSLSWRSK